MLHLYFAYGSNMCRRHMAAHRPTARAAGIAELTGWRFQIAAHGYATVIAVPRARVLGVLWTCTRRDLAALDAYEEVHRNIYRRAMLPVTQAGRRRPALAYVGRSRLSGRPDPTYQRDIVIPAARDWNLPADYVAEREAWLGR